MTVTPIAHPTAAAAETYTIFGNRLSVPLPGEATGGAYSLIDYTLAVGAGGPPVHRHAYDELFVVLHGTVTLTHEGRTFRVGAGEFAFCKGGTAHTFANPDPVPVRLLIVLSPPGFERYFAELAELIAAAGGAPDAADVGALMGRYGVEAVGSHGA
jgi:mannose-6-phosphate isomerase-like protein (cupin superfamily)